MKEVTFFIKSFIERGGNSIFYATISSRIFSFLASIAAIKFIPNYELGIVLFAFNIILFIIPFGGFGLHQSLLRYGARLSTNKEKTALFNYVLKKGFLATIVIILLVNILLYLVDFDIEKTNLYATILSLVLIPSFLVEILKVKFRLQHKNKLFAKIEIISSVLQFIFIFIGSFFFAENGYVIAIILSPLITFIIFINRLNINLKTNLIKTIPTISFWKYGFYGGLTNVVSNFLIIIDIYLIGILLKDPLQVTAYKYISIVPFSLLFLPRVLITTDFVKLTERIYDSVFIKNYITNYLKTFSIISLFLFLFLYFSSEIVLSLFDSDYIIYSDSFCILTFGVCGVLIFRGLFGNLLSSIGKIEINFYINAIAILINIISNYYLIPIFGIKGAAITSALLMWVTGITSAIWFKIIYKKTYGQNK